MAQSAQLFWMPNHFECSLKWTQTDRRTDGRYQTYYLTCLAVNNYIILSILPIPRCVNFSVWGPWIHRFHFGDLWPGRSKGIGDSCYLPSINPDLEATWQLTPLSKLCQGKTCLKIFVVVIPKEGYWRVGPRPANPSLGMTPTTKLYSSAFTDYIL